VTKSNHYVVIVAAWVQGWHSLREAVLCWTVGHWGLVSTQEQSVNLL